LLWNNNRRIKSTPLLEKKKNKVKNLLTETHQLNVPACKNEWNKAYCNKKKVKCGQCKNRSLIPVSDQTIFNHLEGKHTIGVYPLLEDETCWFLAVDFDKKEWQSDIAAFHETCRTYTFFDNANFLERDFTAICWSTEQRV